MAARFSPYGVPVAPGLVGRPVAPRSGFGPGPDVATMAAMAVAPRSGFGPGPDMATMMGMGVDPMVAMSLVTQAPAEPIMQMQPVVQMPLINSQTYVNPAHVNPSKRLFEGGVSFKSILKERLDKQLHRLLSTHDFSYTVSGIKPRKVCHLTLPCMGPDKQYITDACCADDKQAHHMAAAKAMEDLFPDLHEACLLAHSTGQGTGGSQQEQAMGEPKGKLNQMVQLCTGRPLQKTDITYEVAWEQSINGYTCKLELHTMDQCYTGAAPNESDWRVAEKNVARLALDANKDRFLEAVTKHEMDKIRKDSKNDKYRPVSKGKGKGKGFGGYGNLHMRRL